MKRAGSPAEEGPTTRKRVRGTKKSIETDDTVKEQGKNKAANSERNERH